MTVADEQVAVCLAAIRDRSNSLGTLIGGLSSEAWGGDTNCSPWRVSDLATHIVTSGQGFVRNIRRGLAGSVEPDPGGSHAFEGGPPEVAAELAQVTDAFEALY